MKCILVTGGAGFVGSHLCDALLDRGHRIVAVDNLSLGRKANIAHLCSHPNFQFCEQDVLDEPKMAELFRSGRIDAVFHLAANSDIAVSREDPSIDLTNTFMTTYAVLDQMRQYGVKEIVFASSSAVYGETAEAIAEDFGPLLPQSHYGAAKLASEGFLASFSENYGITAWIVRFPNVVGERATHGVIFDFIRKLRGDPSRLEVLGDGEQLKPYLYVMDLVAAMLCIWEGSSERVNVFNVAGRGRTKVSDIAAWVVREMNLSPEIAYTGGDRGWIGDVPQFDYDTGKVERLGWKARYPSDEAVQLSIRKILEEGPA